MPYFNFGDILMQFCENGRLEVRPFTTSLHCTLVLTDVARSAVGHTDLEPQVTELYDCYLELHIRSSCIYLCVLQSIAVAVN